MKIVLAITGASGSLYARLLAQDLKAAGAEIVIIMTDNACKVMAYEDDVSWSEQFTVYDNHDMFSPPASGSARFDAMVVIPCSMGTMSRISCGVSADLIGRAADVMLKERRRLVLCVRETPYNSIHTENMHRLSLAGAIVMPLSPSFYSGAATIDDLCHTVTDRVISLLGVEHKSYIWGEKSK